MHRVGDEYMKIIEMRGKGNKEIRIQLARIVINEHREALNIIQEAKQLGLDVSNLRYGIWKKIQERIEFVCRLIGV